ncbi:phosphotransferase family protein [Caproiciproducens faecalis]|uniref:Aminoglycoside phosphotransferase family protein n=1 Tax=Caproiciproducens faecalis TaxID=2820301 RepID=A0ABS7DJE4_9FIRM|nr:aminoglycoside phosphotransferase family protein [Caproiciproducens faecalis]MBW7571407.1 aminoglycoside phosphotransferase family protein [Caproiciproducens faecalis]
MIDIGVEKILKEYLITKGFVAEDGKVSIRYFDGGVSGTVALVNFDGKLMLVKQALPKLKVKENWFSNPKRMLIEKDGNEVYYSIVPENTLKVYFYDEENYIYGREAASEDCKMWKTDLLEGLLDFQVADKAIMTLAKIHEAVAKDEALKAKFSDKSFFYDLRISPYIESVVKKHPQLEAYAAPICRKLMESSITLVHGDYSPKNILVEGRKIYVLDFEVSHCGHPAFDLAFLANHFLLKSVKNKELAPSYLNMLHFMLHRYFDYITFMDRNELEKDTIQLLALLFLARVDGKSPVEYIDLESDKNIVRQTAFEMISSGCDTFKQAISILDKFNKDIQI